MSAASAKATANRSARIVAGRKAIGLAFAKARYQLQLSVAEVAERTGLTATQVEGFESGGRRQPVERFVRMCTALELDARDIIGIADRAMQAAVPTLD